MRLTREQMEERYMLLPDVIKELSHENPVIHDLVGQYRLGRIITEREFLLQCIIHLNTSWDKLKDDYIQYRSMVVNPLFVSNQSPLK